MKLELKDLAPYLPYKLEILCDYGCDELLRYYLSGIHSDNTIFDSEGEDFTLEDIKPILRPLSDLTEDSRFLSSDDYMMVLEGDVDSFIILNYFSYRSVESLFENHFDVFGLIEKGLAIDINTLEDVNN